MKTPKQTREVGGKVILDLCGGSGSWSKPYKDAGYKVILIDLPNDVRLLSLPKGEIYGILAAPPCTMFCRMRMVRGRPTDAQFLAALSIVDACLRIITICKPKFWALENPQGYLKTWLGEPQLKFNPCDYGDPWTKRTWLWGNFKTLKQNPVTPTKQWIDDGSGKGIAKRSERSITPQGFAQAFFKANQ